MMRPLGLLGVLLAASSALAGPPVHIENLMVGTNQVMETPQRIGKAEVMGEEFCRVKYQQSGTTIEMFPIRHGKTKVWIYDAFDGKPFLELRINVCTKETIALYDRYAGRYRNIEGLVVDIEDNRLTFSGQVFSMTAYREITEAAGAEGYSTQGLELHPYVNAVLAEPLSDLAPPPQRGAAGGEGSPAGDAEAKAPAP